MMGMNYREKVNELTSIFSNIYKFSPNTAMFPLIKQWKFSPQKVAGTDYTFICPNRYAVRGFVNNTAAPTWTYVFNHSMSFTSWGQNFTYCDGHSCEEIF